MSKSLIQIENSIPNLSCDEQGFVYCELYEVCPERYCEKRIQRIPEKNKCLILERALYKQLGLDHPYINEHKSNISEKL